MTLKELLRMFDTYTELWINCLHVFENVQDIPEEWQGLTVTLGERLRYKELTRRTTVYIIRIGKVYHQGR